ncbi:MAG: hypothetical protein ACFFCP_06910 [Promethearchaeota archaeon]
MLIICLILATLFCTIPFNQEIEVTKTEMYTSSDLYHIEISFGGPRFTSVTVICNRTAEINFMYQAGVWIGTESVLLASFRSVVVRYDFKTAHATNIVEVKSDGPFLARIVYTYLIETQVSLFSRALNLFDR